MVHEILSLTAEDVAASVTMTEAIDLMKPAFEQLSSGEAVAPVRINMDMKAVNAQSLIMPVFLPNTGYYAVKTVSLNYNNPELDLPFIHATLTLFNATTGEPLAIMDAEYLTAMRTGAASGLATDLLARKDAQTMALFGAGIQGRKQIDAMISVRPIHKIYVFDIDLDKAIEYAAQVELETQIKTTATQNQLMLNDVDIICTATTSSKSVFEHQYLKSGVHINGIGAYNPNLIEIPVDTIIASKLVVDQRASCLIEAGDVLQAFESGKFSENDVHAELGEIVSGSKKSRVNAEEITIFKSVGNAVQDLALASLAYNKAIKSKRGNTTKL